MKFDQLVKLYEAKQSGPPYIHVDQYGTKNYFKDPGCTILHREDGPARIWINGTESWWLDNNRYRVDGPAVIRTDGSYEW